jgi:hypothetical protein
VAITQGVRRGAPDPYEIFTSRGSPEWVSRSEAAFLAGVAVERVDRWIRGGLVESRTLVPGDPRKGVVLVRASDLAWAGGLDGAGDRLTASSPETAGGVPVRRPSRWWRSVQIGIASLLLVVLGPNAVPGPNTASATDESSTRTSSSSPGSPSTGGAASPTLIVRWLGFVGDGDRIDVVAEIANPDPDRWLPSGDATLVVRNGNGTVLATAALPVAIGPGGERTVIARGIGLGTSSPRDVASVELVPPNRALLPAATYRHRAVRLGEVAVAQGPDGLAAEGNVENDGPTRADVTVSCALRTAAGDLVRVASVRVGEVPPSASAPFRVAFPDAGARDGSAACTVSV